MGRPNLSVSHHKQKQQQERRAVSAPVGAGAGAGAGGAPAGGAAPAAPCPQPQPQHEDARHGGDGTFFDEQELEAMVHCAPNTATTIVSAAGAPPAPGAAKPPTHDTADDEDGGGGGGATDDHAAVADTEELEEEAATAPAPAPPAAGDADAGASPGSSGGSSGSGADDDAAPTPASEEPRTGGSRARAGAPCGCLTKADAPHGRAWGACLPSRCMRPPSVACGCRRHQAEQPGMRAQERGADRARRARPLEPQQGPPVRTYRRMRRPPPLHAPHACCMRESPPPRLALPRPMRPPLPRPPG
jgi:hypothetical protein